MPLLKSSSKKALQKNIETEMEANPSPKDHAQNLAIAYSTQRHNKKKMAKGGMAMNPKLAESKKMPHDHDEDCGGMNEGGMCKYAEGGIVRYGGKAEMTTEPGVPMRKPDDTRIPEDQYASDNWSEGNPPKRKPDDLRPPEDEYMAGHFADGGQVNSQARYPSEQKTESLRKRNTVRTPMSSDEHEISKNDDAGYNSNHYEGSSRDTNEPSVPGRKPDDRRLSKDEYMDSTMKTSYESEGRDNYPTPDDDYMGEYATRGGDNRGTPPSDHYAEENADKMSIAESIIRKKESDGRKYADGGMVDLNKNSEEEPNQYYDADLDAAKKEQYDDSQLGPDPMDSNEHGDDREQSRHDDLDHIDMIRRKMKSMRNGGRY